MLSLTSEEMLARWRSAHGLLSTVAGLAEEFSPELNDLHTAAIEEWYARLLAEGPEELNDPIDYSGTVTMPPAARGTVTFGLPPEAVRLLRVRLRGWRCDARIIPDPDGTLTCRQADPYTRASPDAPVALLRPGGFVTLAPAVDDNVPETILCTGRQADGRYHFHESALTIHFNDNNP